MSKQQLIGAGLVLGSMASSTVADYAGIANQALGVLYLKYSRDDESQADLLGLRYMTRANFDPRRMPEVFRMLDQMSAAEGGGQVPTWLATHPSPANRVDAITKQIAGLPQNFSGTVVSSDSYLKRLDGQVFGDDPREGYFHGSRFLHPGSRFQMVFPDGWTTQNGKQAVVAVAPGQDGAIELSTAQEASAAAVAKTFLTQQGIKGGTSSRATVNGLVTVSAPFAAETSGGSVQGSVLFVEYRGGVFALIGYAPDARWSTYKTAVESTLHSFRALTDPAALDMQPQRVQIIKLAARTTIAILARQRPSPASAATLALINQVSVDTPLEAGRLVKWVVGPAT